MKKEPNPKPARDGSGEMRAEYQFDYRQAKPNRFAPQVEKKRVLVALEPDVAEVFTKPDAVNDVLRALIRTMPRMTRRKTRSLSRLQWHLQVPMHARPQRLR